MFDEWKRINQSLSCCCYIQSAILHLKNKRDVVDSLMRLTENARCYIVLLNLFFFCVKESAHSICFSSM